MDAALAVKYRELYSSHWWWRARERYILATLERLAPWHGWPRILDVGCGDGLLFESLSQYGVVEGVEIDPTVLSSDPAARGIHVGPFDVSFQPERTYSLILMLDVLEHMSDPAGALRHAISVLEPEGLILVTVPAFSELWTSHDDLNHHVLRYTIQSFRALAEAAGTVVIEQRYLFHWLYPLKRVVRMWERLYPSKPQVPRIPSFLVNELLFLVCASEQTLFGKLAVPWGSSLMVVLRPGLR